MSSAASSSNLPKMDPFKEGGHNNDGDRNQSNQDESIPSIDQRGEFVALGSTSFVELLPTGDILKRPCPAHRPAADEYRHDLATESEIYDRLGPHPRLVKKKSWDPTEHALVLEYMPNGTLEDYLKAHPEVSFDQRLRWIKQAAESVRLLHAAGVIHCDIGPPNFLLDADLDLKIFDFGGSSLDQSCVNIRGFTRYFGPDLGWSTRRPPKPENDIFSLGSMIYFIITGAAPLEDVPSKEVERRYRAHEFPELAGIPYADIISKCWHWEFSSAEEVVGLIESDRARQRYESPSASRSVSGGFRSHVCHAGRIGHSQPKTLRLRQGGWFDGSVVSEVAVECWTLSTLYHAPRSSTQRDGQAVTSSHRLEGLF